MAWATFFDTARDGPVLHASFLEAVGVALHPDEVARYINPTLVGAEQSMPEGSLVEITIYGWSVPGLGSHASWVASQIQAAYQRGEIQAPTGEQLQAWPTMNGVIAIGDDATDSVTLRWTKQFAWAIPIILLVVGILLGIGIVYLLTRNSASGRYQAPDGQTRQPTTILGWVADHWQLVLGGAALAVVVPWGINRAADLRRAERRYKDAGRR